MAPSTPVIDAFNRADESPLSDGGAWTNKVLTADNAGGLQILTNRVGNTSAARAGMYRNDARYVDCEAYFTFAVAPVSDGTGLFVRLQDPNTAGGTGYMGWYAPGGGGNVRIWRLSGGNTFTDLTAGGVSVALVAGDKLWLRAVGHTITLATFSAATGVWTDRVSITESANPAIRSGYIGIIGGAETTFRLDDFGGGSIATNVDTTTPNLDNFNRADENPLSDSGAWTQKILSTDNNLQLATNQVKSANSAGRSGAYWNDTTRTDCEAFVTVATPPASSADGVGLWLRVANPGLGTVTGYMAWYLPGFGVRIWRFSGGAFTVLSTVYEKVELLAGDKLLFRAESTTLTLAVSLQGGPWVPVIQLTDASFASGFIGIFGGAEANWRVDDFGGGILHATFPDFIASHTTAFAPQIQALELLPFISSVTAVYTPALQADIGLSFIASATLVYPPTLVGSEVDVPFIATATTVYALTVLHHQVDVPFIASSTRVFGVFSLFVDRLYAGPGNGGEIFAVRLAAAGTSSSATLLVALSDSGTLLQLAGDGGLPTDAAFALTVDGEVLYVSPRGGGAYEIRGRGLSNTVAAAHAAGATATWGDSYDMAIVAASDLAHDFTADITGSGSHTYPGWLMCFDATQAYLAGSRYPMHVSEVLGVFDAGAGAGGTNRCDAAQPNAIASTTGVSDNCPAALSNPSRIQSDILTGDVALVRYTNPEASPLDLGPRSTALQSWFGMKRVDATDTDVTFTDPTGHVVDGSIEGEWHNPLGPGIAPDTGLPTSHDVPYTSVTLPGSSRTFTHGSPGYSEKGWPIGVLAVRQGNRRIPFWKSWDWRDFSYVYSGFGVDATFAQIVINRNGIVFGSVPSVDLPGPQDIDGPDAVWDDGSYYFGVAWYVAIFNGPYLVIGPSLGGSSGAGGGGGGVTPTVSFPAGPGSPVVSTPPAVEGGSGGDVSPPLSTGLHVNQRI